MRTYTTSYTSPVGPLKIECSEDYIRAVIYINGEDAIIQQDEHSLLQSCVQQLDEYFSGTRKTFDLPIQQPGTTFQQKVWELLIQIPFGKTISYHDLSKQYGDLKAIRAVASANGKNNLAIIIPCHRVIGSNQSLIGYSGGIWRKKWLLEHEAKHHSGVITLF